MKLSADVEQSAGQLAAPHGLRGADAAHLASAVALSATDLNVAVWDRPLHAGVLDGCERAAADLADEIVADWQCLSEGVAGWPHSLARFPQGAVHGVQDMAREQFDYGRGGRSLGVGIGMSAHWDRTNLAVDQLGRHNR